MYDVDRSTHRKILIVGSAAAMIVVAVAANARTGSSHGPTVTVAPAVPVTPPPLQRREITPPPRKVVHPVMLAHSGSGAPTDAAEPPAPPSG
jgi:hypothetical protein